MKYTTEILINRPISEIVKLFDNPENMQKWQPELITMETLSGPPGKAGSKSKLKYKMGNKEVEMIETITKNDLPEEFSATYEAKGAFNIVSNRFVEINSEKTKWISHNEFKLSGFMKLFGLFMPGSFKNQSYKYMENFKKFAEFS
jgi:hypothetical protein